MIPLGPGAARAAHPQVRRENGPLPRGARAPLRCPSDQDPNNRDHRPPARRPPPGGTRRAATRCDAHGQAVGTSTTAAGEEHAFLWSGGRMTDLTALAPGVRAVVDINDAGQVVGFDPQGGRAVVWDVPVPS